jgi:hypothetical protein
VRLCDHCHARLSASVSPLISTFCTMYHSAFALAGEIDRRTVRDVHALVQQNIAATHESQLKMFQVKEDLREAEKQIQYLSAVARQLQGATPFVTPQPDRYDIPTPPGMEIPEPETFTLHDSIEGSYHST